MTKVSKNFHDHELVDPEIMENDDLLADWFISEWQIQVAEELRKRYGVIIINDYGFGGGTYAEDITYNYSGTRPPFKHVIGAMWSQHKFMNALDVKPKELTNDELKDDILKNEQFFLNLGVTTMESRDIADTWTHLDGRRWGYDIAHIQIVGK